MAFVLLLATRHAFISAIRSLNIISFYKGWVGRECYIFYIFSSPFPTPTNHNTLLSQRYTAMAISSLKEWINRLNWWGRFSMNLSTLQHFLFLVAETYWYKKNKICIRVSSSCDPTLNYSHVESHVISVSRLALLFGNVNMWMLDMIRFWFAAL